MPSAAVNATWRPSGETTAGPGPFDSSQKVVPSGGGRAHRKTRSGFLVAKTTIAASPAAATSAAAAIVQARRSRLLRRATTGGGRPACAPPAAIHWSWSLTPCAVWMRPSGSFARHVATTRSRGGGVMGASDETAGGESFRIEPMTLAWLFPSKAVLPVAIS